MRKVCSQLSAYSSLHYTAHSLAHSHASSVVLSFDRWGPWRTKKDGRTSIVAVAKKKKASAVHPEAFLESRAGSSNGVSGPRLLPPPLLLVVVHCTVGW